MPFPDSHAGSEPPPGGGAGAGGGGSAGSGAGGGTGGAAAASGLDSIKTGLAPEIARRVSSIFDAVEHEAEGLRAQAREEARSYLVDAQRRADDLVRRRQERIGELSDELLQKAEAVVSRLDSAAPVRQGFESLVRALGGAAERLSGEISDPAAAPAPAAPEPSAAAPVAEGTAAPRAWETPGAGAPGAWRTPGVGAPGAWGTPGAAGVSSAAGAGTPPPGVHPPPRFGGVGAGPAAGEWNDSEAARLGAIQMAAAGATRAEVRTRLEPRTGPEAADAILDSIFGAAGENERVPWTAFGG